LRIARRHSEKESRNTLPNTTMKTTVILFRNEQKTWTLSRYKGNIVPSSEFKTSTAARAYAKSKGWNVRRATNCDY